MPINIPDKLPAKEALTKENVFILSESKALKQDIRPMKICILNLMPLKIDTEIQLLRLLANNPLQIEVDLIRTISYESKNISSNHLAEFYKTFFDIRNNKFDGMIITGAPIEHLDFKDVAYWNEIKAVFDWATINVTSTLFICWAANAGLYHHYGIPKYELPEKMFGVFKHKVLNKKLPIVRGFDDEFEAPHSRFSEFKKDDVLKLEELEIVSESADAGIFLIAAKNKRRIFVTGHAEYDALTLKQEYLRDLKKGLKISIPKNYFTDNDPEKKPFVKWRSHAHLLFSNWLNYYVYQETPYKIHKIT